ncbi:SH2 domain-containing protein 4A isoform X1 [Megalobrama amblycephala]|uniref:SH2 domain-containing protein 4A isoform X1 n=1 Tax=Megalobrama amblycephala TaxID=75352 RepID=UPI002013C6D1|nr:SH2 domain-containing protein 4A isoform X1 [Megalobrama amblycephala]XP_048027923.1 SH2 domain-containing protein 4A isoform X1 [Megalobrama amblycephala]XP_048027931.1 SH2 domain-containing protein 4A isoform X1 [Megalobrama amblycephala]XP_048027938.1 SH2 domain-containing protein 4A isoform X1 [Megalobrama amblycephala]
MLQQILADMYIEPELLAELNEEQKQVLFFKMREEQIRKWRERETQLEKEEAAYVKVKKVSGKCVSWMKGLDDDVWVWVMGEHHDDKPYDEICDEIMNERAALQAQREAEQLRAKKEAELEKRFSGLYLEPEQVVLSEQEVQLKATEAAALEQKRADEELKKLELEERRKAEEELRRLEQERKQQIYMNLKEVQSGKQTHDEQDKDWQQTLQKSKAADMRRRSIAKQTIEDHRRRSVKALERGRVAAMTKAFGSTNPTPPPKPKPRNTSGAISRRKDGMRRSLSTSSRDHIIRWFQEEQLPLRAGFQRDQTRIAPWFHGIISREQAEALLNDGEPGLFLVRVSERIFGYVLSYRSKEGIKHLLIDASENCYMLLGDQIKFTSLSELVEYHQVEPLSSSGEEEYLLQACGQREAKADYTELFT